MPCKYIIMVDGMVVDRGIVYHAKCVSLRDLLTRISEPWGDGHVVVVLDGVAYVPWDGEWVEFVACV